MTAMTQTTWSHLIPDSDEDLTDHWYYCQTRFVGFDENRISKLLKNIMSTEQFYKFWEKVALSDLVQNVPEDVEQFCAEHEITVDYFIEEFL